jgi:hypothetical protein
LEWCIEYQPQYVYQEWGKSAWRTTIEALENEPKKEKEKSRTSLPIHTPTLLIVTAAADLNVT